MPPVHTHVPDERDTTEIDLDGDGLPIHHATRVASADGCLRKWGWKWLDGVVEPPKLSTTLGKRVHAIQEGWLTSGDMPPVGEVFEWMDERSPNDEKATE